MYPYLPPSYKGYYARFVILKCWFDSDRRLKKKGECYEIRDWKNGRLQLGDMGVLL